jgi:hypothetical protein
LPEIRNTKRNEIKTKYEDRLEELTNPEDDMFKFDTYAAPPYEAYQLKYGFMNKPNVC